MEMQIALHAPENTVLPEMSKTLEIGSNIDPKKIWVNIRTRGSQARICVRIFTQITICHDLDTGLICAVGITPANIPEASVTEAISVDLEQQGACLKELHIDRAYLSSHLVRERSAELEIYCTAWPVRGGKRFHKQAFTLDWERQIIRCPAEQEMPFVPGDVVYFPKGTCAQCPLKAQCTTSTKGRSVSIHPDEALLIELRQRQQTRSQPPQTT